MLCCRKTLLTFFLDLRCWAHLLSFNWLCSLDRSRRNASPWLDFVSWWRCSSSLGCSSGLGCWSILFESPGGSTCCSLTFRPSPFRRSGRPICWTLRWRCLIHLSVKAALRARSLWQCRWSCSAASYPQPVPLLKSLWSLWWKPLSILICYAHLSKIQDTQSPQFETY